MNEQKFCKNYIIITVSFLVLITICLIFAYYASIRENESFLVIRPEIDHRNFKTLVLRNDIKVLLISDPLAKKSGASLNINSGYFSEPRNISGISHLLEHMILKGSVKYPGANEFSSFLMSNGGTYNAYTGKFLRRIMKDFGYYLFSYLL